MYYISKEEETMNAIFKVSGSEGTSGTQNGNIAMGLFNGPSSVAVFDNNPKIRKEQDNLVLIKFHDKFFDQDLDAETQDLKDNCMQWAHQSNYSLCGTMIEREFQPPFDPEVPENKAANDRAYLNWLRVDHTRIKLIPWVENPILNFEHSDDIDPRVIYIADKQNHCIRRILAKQANVDTFAGVCGVPGFKDGLFGQNLLDSPELVGVDHNGTVYVYDSGNQYIRIIDPATKVMRTMIHGSCKLDYLTSRPKIRVPFQLKLRPMICFKSWIKEFGEPQDHLVVLPSVLEIIDPEAVITGYGDELPEEEE